MMRIISLLSCVFLAGTVYASSPAVESRVWYSGEGPGAIEGGTGTRFASTNWGFELPMEKRSKRREFLQTKLHFDWTEFDWEGTTAAEEEYFWLSMPVHYRQQRSRKHMFLIDVEPGLMTDGTNIDFDSVGLNAMVRGRIMRRKGGYWQYGLVVNREFGDFNVRPVLGAGWQASRRTWVDLGFPRTNVEHTLSSTVKSFFRIQPAGGVWKHEIDGQSDTFTLRYTSWKAGVGLSFQWRRKLWLSGEIGQLRNRSVRGYAPSATAGTAPTSVRGAPGNDRYWQLSASMRF